MTKSSLGHRNNRASSVLTLAAALTGLWLVPGQGLGQCIVNPNIRSSGTPPGEVVTGELYLPFTIGINCVVMAAGPPTSCATYSTGTSPKTQYGGSPMVFRRPVVARHNGGGPAPYCEVACTGYNNFAMRSTTCSLRIDSSDGLPVELLEIEVD